MADESEKKSGDPDWDKRAGQGMNDLQQNFAREQTQLMVRKAMRDMILELDPENQVSKNETKERLEEILRPLLEPAIEAKGGTKPSSETPLRELIPLYRKLQRGE